MNRVNKKNYRSEKSQGHRGHRKVKCEISQALVIINLYVKFNVYCSYAEQVIELEVADRRTDGRTNAPGDDNGHPPKFWLRPKNYTRTVNPCTERVRKISIILLENYRNYGMYPE